jgi:hypothetical protein
MIGTGYPFPWTSTKVDLMSNIPALTRAQPIAHPGRHSGEAVRDHRLQTARLDIREGSKTP